MVMEISRLDIRNGHGKWAHWTQDREMSVPDIRKGYGNGWLDIRNCHGNGWTGYKKWPWKWVGWT